MKKMMLYVAALTIAMLPVVGVADHIGHHGCAACHMPHGTIYTDGVPLWSGLQSSEAITMYDEGNNITRMVADVSDDPTGATKLCLGCHDGIGSGYIGRHEPGTHSNMGTDLRHTHPISFSYAESYNGTVGEYRAPWDLEFGYVDRNGEVQCSSCHDVHLPGNRTLSISTYGGEVPYGGYVQDTDQDGNPAVDANGDPIMVENYIDPVLRANGMYYDGADGGQICQKCHLKGVSNYTATANPNP